jgi:hypothetical protein
MVASEWKAEWERKMNIHVFKFVAGALLLVFGMSASAAIHLLADNLPYSSEGAELVSADKKVTASFQYVDGNDNAPHSHQAAPAFSTEDVAAKKRCVGWVPSVTLNGHFYPGFCVKWASLSPVDNGLSYSLPDIDGGNLDPVQFSAAKRCVAWVPAVTIAGQYYPGFCARWASSGPVGNRLSYAAPDIDEGNRDSIQLSAAKRCVGWVPSVTINGQFYPGFCAKWASLSPVGNDLSYSHRDIDAHSVDPLNLSATKQCIAWVPSMTLNGQYFPGVCLRWKTASADGDEASHAIRTADVGPTEGHTKLDSVPFELTAGKGAPRCLLWRYDVMIGGVFYDQYCMRWQRAATGDATTPALAALSNRKCITIVQNGRAYTYCPR